jgi:hypothetical protein
MERINVEIRRVVMRVYSVFDRKLREYGQLITARNDLYIMRSLEDFLASSKQEMMAKYPADFDLFELASFDPESGVVEATMPPRLVANLEELVQPTLDLKEQYVEA